MRETFPLVCVKMRRLRGGVRAKLAIIPAKVELSLPLPDRYANTVSQFVVLCVREVRIAQIPHTARHSVSYTWNQTPCIPNLKIFVRACSTQPPPQTHCIKSNLASRPTTAAPGQSP